MLIILREDVVSLFQQPQDTCRITCHHALSCQQFGYFLNTAGAYSPLIYKPLYVGHYNCLQGLK